VIYKIDPKKRTSYPDFKKFVKNLAKCQFYYLFLTMCQEAGLAQSVERQALNLMVEGSSPSFGEFCLLRSARSSVAGAAAGLQNRG
jgi:hypothetical protein